MTTRIITLTSLMKTNTHSIFMNPAKMISGCGIYCGDNVKFCAMICSHGHVSLYTCNSKGSDDIAGYLCLANKYNGFENAIEDHSYSVPDPQIADLYVEYHDTTLFVQLFGCVDSEYNGTMYSINNVTNLRIDNYDTRDQHISGFYIGTKGSGIRPGRMYMKPLIIYK